MEFLRKSWAQVADSYRTMSPSSRLTLVLLCVMVVLSLGYLLMVSRESDAAYVLDGHVFTNTQLAAAERALEAQGLKRYTIRGNRIEAPRQELPKYEAALVSQGAVPEEFSDTLDKVLELGSGGPLVTEETRRWRRLTLKEARIAKILGWCENIQRAAVSIDRKETGFLAGGETVVASVSIQPKPGHEFTRKHADSVRQFVSCCVAGLRPENIRVVDTSRGKTFEVPEDDFGGTDLLEHRQAWKRDFEASIRNVLAFIDGVIVGVHVGLQNSRETSEDVRYNPKEVAPEFKKSETRSSKAENKSKAGEPGLNPNTGAEVNTGGAAGQSTSEDFDSTEEKNKISQRVTRIQTPPGQVAEVGVSVVVPRSYYLKAFKEANPKAGDNPDKEQLEPFIKAQNDIIRNLVAAVIPKGQANTVTVTDYPAIGERGPAEATQAAEPIGIGAVASHYGSSIGLGLLALVSLAMVRGVIRRSLPEPAERQTTPLPVQEALDSQEEGALPGLEMDPERLKAIRMQEQVAEIVRQNPELAANMLKRWISKDA